MAKYTVIKLKQLTPLHIGTGKENYDFSADDLQSDTISAALSAIRAQRGKSADIESFMNSFTITSAFPYIENHYFLPKMQGKLNVIVDGANAEEKRKELKKIKYVELPVWQKLISNEQISVKETQLMQKYLIAETTQFGIPAKSEVMQRVSVAREDGQDAAPFYFNWTYFDKRGGLFFLINAEKEIEKEVVELFKKLGEAGIGTDRNVGGGKFEIDTDSIEIRDNPTSNALILLSMYIPSKDEMVKINLSNSRYQILQRGGYIAGSEEEEFRHLRKKSIYMFSVGSVFPAKESLIGKVVNLTPEWNDKRMHSVFRSGRPFCLPVTI